MTKSTRRVVTGGGLAIAAAAIIVGVTSQHKITLTWTGSTTPNVTYTIYKAGHNKPAYFGVTKPIAVATGLKATTYVDSAVTQGDGPYSYAVCAVNINPPNLVTCESPEIKCTVSNKKCTVGAPIAQRELPMCNDGRPLLLKSKASRGEMLDYMQRYDTQNCRFVIDDSPTSMMIYMGQITFATTSTPLAIVYDENGAVAQCTGRNKSDQLLNGCELNPGYSLDDLMNVVLKKEITNARR